VAAPTIRVWFSVLISQRRLKGTTMERAFDDIGGGACLWWHMREEEFRDHAFTCHANGTLLL
jgi:hypothetical protein